MASCSQLNMPTKKACADPMPRFWAKVRLAGLDECWDWMRAKDRDGYGAFNPADGTGRKVTRAPRFLMERLHGWIAPELVVMHTCDNRACVNPRHLRLGTNAENVADRDAKGRQSYGPRNPMSKVTPELVRQMRSLRQQGLPDYEIAAWAGMSTSQTNKIVRGVWWRHVA